MTIGALVLLPFGVHGAWHVAGQPHLMFIALGTAMLGSVVPYTLELAAMRRAPRRVFGILLSMEPAVATLAGWLLLSQRTVPVAIAAIGTVVLASMGSVLGTRTLPGVSTRGVGCPGLRRGPCRLTRASSPPRR
jgi:inner membrane transporter RhtA